jgi:hypothetical protein
MFGRHPIYPNSLLPWQSAEFIKLFFSSLFSSKKEFCSVQPFFLCNNLGDMYSVTINFGPWHLSPGSVFINILRQFSQKSKNFRLRSLLSQQLLNTSLVLCSDKASVFCIRLSLHRKYFCPYIFLFMMYEKWLRDIWPGWLQHHFHSARGERGVLLIYRWNCPCAYNSLMYTDQLDSHTTTKHALFRYLFFSGIEMSLRRWEK